jgi:class 3 adenylate cyclase
METADVPGPDPPSVPEHLGELARASRAALQGERKQVTVLFADVKGSMELAEDLDPEEWHGVMDRFMRILTEGVHRFEGTVDKFTGDGIMALFGAPVAHEDHARRACYAALHLAEAIGRYAEELRRTKGLSFHTRMGLNSGEVIVGNIGDDAHMEYTAVGHTVGLAQRMEALAEPGRAYMTEHTAALVSGWFHLRELGPVAVKGAREPIGVSVLEGAGGVRSTYEVARWRGLSRMVGRAEEMAALESALAKAVAGDGQVMGVVGEAGVGKSRLCEEFAQSCQAREIGVYRAHGVSHGRNLPFLPALELLRQFFGVTDADSPQTAREKVAGTLLLYDALQRSSEELPILFDFLEIADSEQPAPQMAPEARLRRIFTIIRQASRRRSERETRVILLEDLHWFDAASEDFLEMLVETYQGTRTLVLTNFRPEFHGRWMRHSYYRQLPLAPLGVSAVRELLGGLLGTHPSLGQLADHIVERTGGNPFFVEEVVRSLIEDGALEGGPAAYRLTRRLEDLRVPATLQALLSARIDRLATSDKQVLQTAAVVGRTFSEPVLRRVTGLAEDDLASSLCSLRSAEFLQETALYPVAEYRFWHPLTQEVAYGSLLGERRSRLHAAVAEAIAVLDPERADERSALLAQHWEAAGEALEAARWNARAAKRSAFRDLLEARRRWQATVRLLKDVPESDETLDLGVTARARLARLAFRLGAEPGESEALTDEARLLAERRGDPIGLALTHYAKGFVLFGLGQLDAAVGFVHEAMRLGEESGHREMSASRFILAYMLSVRGPLPLGLSYTDDILKLAETDPDLGVPLFGARLSNYSLFHRAWLLARMGRLAEAARTADRIISIGRERSELELAAWGLPVHGLIAFLAGGGADAVGRTSDAVALSDELGSPLHMVLALQGLGAAYLAAGRAEDGLRPLQDALSLARERHVALFEEASLLAYLADAYLQVGDPDAALRAAEDALAVARAQRARVHECQALLSHARVLRLTIGTAAGEAIAADLAEANTAIEETGAHAWSPFLHEEHALAKELDSP